MMRENRWQPIALVSLLAVGQATANEVKKVEVSQPGDRSAWPVVEVYSNSGEKWDTVVKGKPSAFRLSTDSRCKFPIDLRKFNESLMAEAHEGRVEIYGFALSGVAPDGNSFDFGWPATVQGQATLVTGGDWPAKATQACNAELDKRLATQAGKTRYELLAQGFEVDYAAFTTAGFTLTCHPTGAGFTDIGSARTDVSVVIKCLPSAAAQAKIPKKVPAPVLPAIKSVKLSAQPSQFNGFCPAKVVFKGSLSVYKPGLYKYRFISHDGKKKSGNYQLDFLNPGSKPTVDWSTVVKRPGGLNKLAAQTDDKPYVEEGRYWIEVEGPDGKKKRDKADYRVTCLKPMKKSIVEALPGQGTGRPKPSVNIRPAPPGVTPVRPQGIVRPQAPGVVPIKPQAVTRPKPAGVAPLKPQGIVRPKPPARAPATPQPAPLQRRQPAGEAGSGKKLPREIVIVGDKNKKQAESDTAGRPASPVRLVPGAIRQPGE